MDLGLKVVIMEALDEGGGVVCELLAEFLADSERSLCQEDDSDSLFGGGVCSHGKSQ